MAEGILVETSVCSIPQVSCLRTVLAPPDWQMREPREETTSFLWNHPKTPLHLRRSFPPGYNRLLPQALEDKLSPPSTELLIPRAQTAHTASASTERGTESKSLKHQTVDISRLTHLILTCCSLPFSNQFFLSDFRHQDDSMGHPSLHSLAWRSVSE